MVQVHDREEIKDAVGTEGTMLEDATNRTSEIAAAVTDEFVPIGWICTPASELSDYADDADTQYLVIGGRKRPPISKALFGSVTQAVLLSVDMSGIMIRTK